MPSADLLFYFQRHLQLEPGRGSWEFLHSSDFFASSNHIGFSQEKHWHVNGRHYQLTAEGWLQNLDENSEKAMRWVASE